jgi:hypothetical protein
MFWRDEHLEAVHLVVPAAEAGARRLLRELDEGIYQVQIGKDPGTYPGMWTLLDALGGLGLDPSWHWFLRWLFLGPSGVNLRNDVAHGFVTDIDAAYTALVLRSAAVLITASTVIDGEHRAVHVAGPPAPRPGLNGVLDRTLKVTSQGLLGAHLLVESLRRRLR